MATVVQLSEHKRRPKHVCFDRHELNKLLSLYSRRVIDGEWKDYAISHGNGMASFSIFRNAIDGPAFTVIKYAAGAHGNGDYLVCRGSRRLKRANSLGAVLDVFEHELKLVST